MDRRDLPGCATVARAVGDEPLGTAPLMRSWVLIEHPLAWPADAHKRLPGLLLAPRRAERLRELSGDAGMRPMLIRRVGRRSADPGRTVLVGSASGSDGGGWVERIRYDDLAEPIDVDLDAVAAGERGHGEPVSGPVFLACTHGTRDLCCATFGRPIAASLAAAYPDRVWESSHQGGHRFAANLLVLPHGVAYGRMDPGDAARAADAAFADEMLVDGHVRGSTLVDGPAQAAELAVRRELGLTAVAAVRTVDGSARPVGPDLVAVVVRAGERAFSVVVRHERAEVADLSRCGDLHPQRHVVERFHELAPAG